MREPEQHRCLGAFMSMEVQIRSEREPLSQGQRGATAKHFACEKPHSTRGCTGGPTPLARSGKALDDWKWMQAFIADSSLFMHCTALHPWFAPSIVMWSASAETFSPCAAPRTPLWMCVCVFALLISRSGIIMQCKADLACGFSRRKSHYIFHAIHLNEGHSGSLSTPPTELRVHKR